MDNIIIRMARNYNNTHIRGNFTRLLSHTLSPCPVLAMFFSMSVSVSTFMCLPGPCPVYVHVNIIHVHAVIVYDDYVLYFFMTTVFYFLY
jgi:hypothetical protein